jgi:DNA-directed RNA polymerase subunit RPC12/RpoP
LFCAIEKGSTNEAQGGVTFPLLSGHVTSSVLEKESSATMAKCPYCDGRIDDEAFVCSFCGRDLNKTYPLPLEMQFTMERGKRKRIQIQFTIVTGVLFTIGLILIFLVWNSY